ncbi:hypothetical protein RD792_003469 [Penstemon davidsonii]|uniref:Uncharacterized protein n=1 Tax=Penstemon davidsonii TaxID=160366 RepID=A0ABR0DUJ1_9LAMI|nr:hypothetical protein RD792_003469 [Penstemon davidsonii]
MSMDYVKEIKAMNCSIEERDMFSIRKGPWSSDEDSILKNYVLIHGEGRWNSLAHEAGLKRTGKSCRLRWLNYLHPNVRRGDFTLEEQLQIIELQCIYGNRWSMIAKHIPGRTDNEIKNFWRTRVQKQAKQWSCDVNSPEFRDLIRNLWIPILTEQIEASKARNTIINSDELVMKNGPSPLQIDYWAGGFYASELSETVMEAQPAISSRDCFRASTFKHDLNPSPWIDYETQIFFNLDNLELDDMLVEYTSLIDHSPVFF